MLVADESMSRPLAGEYHTAALCCQKRRSSQEQNIGWLLSGQEIRSCCRQIMVSKLLILCDKAQVVWSTEVGGEKSWVPLSVARPSIVLSCPGPGMSSQGDFE